MAPGRTTRAKEIKGARAVLLRDPAGWGWPWTWSGGGCIRWRPAAALLGGAGGGRVRGALHENTTAPPLAFRRGSSELASSWGQGGRESLGGNRNSARCAKSWRGPWRGAPGRPPAVCWPRGLLSAPGPCPSLSADDHAPPQGPATPGGAGAASPCSDAARLRRRLRERD
jgi:hypothetical protein